MGLAPGWLDAPELVAASFSLGVSHPPGHPAYILFSHLFALLPIGSVAFRLALFSAFCFGMASWLTYRAGLHLFSAFPRISSDSAWTRLFWLLPTVGAGFVYSTCLQAVRPEEYTGIIISMQIANAAIRLLANSKAGSRRSSFSFLHSDMY